MRPRVGVVGCGAIARRAHAPGLRDAGAEVVAFASRTLASAKAAAADHGGDDGGGYVTDDWRALLARDDIDAVTICTPNALHAEMAVVAAEAGKHVLVEKPLAPSVADCDRMIDAARSAGVLLMPAHNVRFAPPFVAVRDAIRAGQIGDVVSFRAAFGHAGPEAWAPDATWFRDPTLAGGGAMLDLGVHLVDTLRVVIGREVTEVSAVLSGTEAGIDDIAVALLRFEGGAIGSMHISWAARPGPDHQLTVFGTDGTIHLDAHTPPTWFPVTREREQLPLPDATDSLFAAFVRAITGDGTQPASLRAEDGRAAVAVCEAAYRAASTGGLVAVEPLEVPFQVEASTRKNGLA